MTPYQTDRVMTQACVFFIKQAEARPARLRFTGPYTFTNNLSESIAKL